MTKIIEHKVCTLTNDGTGLVLIAPQGTPTESLVFIAEKIREALAEQFFARFDESNNLLLNEELFRQFVGEDPQ